MKYTIPIAMFSVLLMFSNCKREEPFEYPDDPQDVEPSWITETERLIKESENWVPYQSAEGCNPNIHISNLAAYELNYSRGFATIQLAPDTTSCELEVSLTSDFNSSEISAHDWSELNFEFTYNEYKASSGTELWMSLYYKDLELDINLIPIMEKLIPEDTTSGLVKLRFVDDDPLFELNGKEFSPDFSPSTGNHFSMNPSGTDQYFKIRMTSSEINVQSYFAFKFLRISRYGLKDA